MTERRDDTRFETCRVVFWRGYVKCAFYAVAEDGEEPVGSPFFRSRQRSPEQSGRALEAHRELVERLEDEGWEAFARAREWYALTFRRRGWSAVETLLSEEAPAAVPVVEAHRALPLLEPEPEEEPAHEPTQLPHSARHRSGRQLALLVSTAALIALAVVLGLTVFHTNSAQGRGRTSDGPATPRYEPGVQHRKPAVGVLPASRRPGKLVPTTIVVTGSRGTSWVEARIGSATGKPLYAGVVAQGQTVRVSAPVVWVTFGAAGNLDLRVNGRAPVPGTFKGTITAVIAHGRVRSP